jgi:uncharacterized repeat protein (TIGR03803 family)
MKACNFLILVTFGLLLAVAPSQAQTFKVLHTFHSGDGPQVPLGQLILDAAGNLYGVASGGTPRCFGNISCGTVFKMNKSGGLLGVYRFNGADGFDPYAGLVRDPEGNFYGVTVMGGEKTEACGGSQTAGCGVIYKLDPAGKETVLHRFTGGSDGWEPEALLTIDAAGKTLYGTTLWGGGTLNIGVVFKLDQAEGYTVLYTFQGGADGGSDPPGLIWGSPGNLYGIAGYGANNDGVLFDVNAATGQESVLYNFPSNQAYGVGSSLLVADAAGNLYGTTSQGGNLNCDGDYGCGVVYELSPQEGGSWTETVLYTFCSLPNCADGERPLAPVIRDAAGNLYGTTFFGGENGSNCNGGNCGLVFKLDTTGKETVLHTFTGGSDGAFPFGGLVMDAAGNLYGTAEQGGDLNCAINQIKGCGVVFEITP